MKRNHSITLAGLFVIVMFAPCAVCFEASRSGALLGEMLGVSPLPVTYGPFFAAGEGPSSDSASPTGSAEGAINPRDLSDEQIAEMMLNPLGWLWIVVFQHDITWYNGDLTDLANTGDKIMHSTKFQPVMPLKLTDEYSLILRPVIQYISINGPASFGITGGTPTPDPPEVNPLAPGAGSTADFNRQNGLGDTVLLANISNQTKPPFIFGYGPSFMFPTATDNRLGTEKWSVGPSVLALNITEQWVVGAEESNLYMGAPVTLVKAPNGAIVNKKLLDGADKISWLKPTIEQPVAGIRALGGYGLAPMSIIDTDEGLIAFDTGDTKHDGELFLAAIRTFSQKPIKAIIYGHSHTCMGAGVLANGNEDVIVIGHPGLNAVVEKNLQGGGAPAYFPEIGPYLTARALIQFNAYMPSEGPDAWASPLTLGSREMAFVPVNTPVQDGQEMTVLGQVRVRRQGTHDRLAARSQNRVHHTFVGIAPAALFATGRCISRST